MSIEKLRNNPTLKKCDIARAVKEYDEVYAALEQSVALQSHYAMLLNMHDGGTRMFFDSAKEWIERLRKMESKSETNS